MAVPGAKLQEPEPQSTDTVLMVRPARFGSNPQTRGSNAFQSSEDAARDAGSKATAEFDEMVADLRGAGVRVLVLDDDPEPARPDAVFPNNWFSTHRDGTVVLYPMCAPNRRIERRTDRLQHLRAGGLRCQHLIDLSAHEIDGAFLEGTGSMVLDRSGRVAYACISPRTDRGLFEQWAEELGYEPFAFDAVDARGRAIYHTNVLMSIGSGWAVVCLQAIADAAQRAALADRVRAGGRELIEIDHGQMDGFGANILELRSDDGRAVIALSTSAAEALGPTARAALAAHGELVVSAIPTIERAGGGSARCMLAELFLPQEGRPDG